MFNVKSCLYLKPCREENWDILRRPWRKIMFWLYRLASKPWLFNATLKNIAFLLSMASYQAVIYTSKGLDFTFSASERDDFYGCLGGSWWKILWFWNTLFKAREAWLQWCWLLPEIWIKAGFFTWSNLLNLTLSLIILVFRKMNRVKPVVIDT